MSFYYVQKRHAKKLPVIKRDQILQMSDFPDIYIYIYTLILIYASSTDSISITFTRNNLDVSFFL